MFEKRIAGESRLGRMGSLGVRPKRQENARNHWSKRKEANPISAHFLAPGPKVEFRRIANSQRNYFRLVIPVLKY